MCDEDCDGEQERIYLGYKEGDPDYSGKVLYMSNGHCYTASLVAGSTATELTEETVVEVYNDCTKCCGQSHTCFQFGLTSSPWTKLCCFDSTEDCSYSFSSSWDLFGGWGCGGQNSAHTVETVAANGTYDTSSGTWKDSSFTYWKESISYNSSGVPTEKYQQRNEQSPSSAHIPYLKAYPQPLVLTWAFYKQERKYTWNAGSQEWVLAWDWTTPTLVFHWIASQSPAEQQRNGYIYSCSPSYVNATECVDFVYPFSGAEYSTYFNYFIEDWDPPECPGINPLP
jgi:hypothetical protein